MLMKLTANQKNTLIDLVCFFKVGSLKAPDAANVLSKCLE